MVPTGRPQPNPNGAERLWAVSDVHTDSPENRQWIENLSDTEFKTDTLIVSGDVSDDIDILESTLATLKRKFRRVFFTPGNHDLWLGDADADVDSLDKLRRILSLCDRFGVATKPELIGPDGGPRVWVCPLLSWHHQSWDTEPDIQGWSIPSAETVMVDYRACRFPSPLSMLDDSVAEAVDAMNDELAAEALARIAERPSDEALITFSHFLPRTELLLEKRFLTCPQLPKAAGSRFLAARVAALRPTAHVFGHTHFGWDATHDGVRYVQAALAYPSERLARWHTLSVADFGRAGPLLLWSSDRGFAPKASCRWSGYYEHHPREPHRVFELASYTARKFQKTDERATECMPDFSHEAGDTQVAGERRLSTDPVAPQRSA